MDFRVGSPVRRFREATAVSDQDVATIAWRFNSELLIHIAYGAGRFPARRQLRAAQIQNTPPTSELISGITKNNNKDNRNSKNPD